MEKNKNILFTFDYELFLGARSGSVENCIIAPTDQLMQIFDKFNIKQTVFFVDTTYLLRLEEQKNSACENDFNSIKDQLQLLIKKGHYVFPHIHPHWLDAVYNETTNQWSLNDYSKYRFHNISVQQRVELFERSIKLLADIILPVSPLYKINAYRAGGWCIQPFSDFKSLFIKHKIEHEFSVIKDFKNLSEAQHLDFTGAPVDNVYRFEDEVCLKNEKGSFKQYTISTITISGFTYLQNKIWAKYLWKKGFRSGGDGTGLVIKEKDKLNGRSDLFGSSNLEMVSVELLNTVKLRLYKSFLKKNNYMHFISHPKMLSQHNIKCFEQFLDYATRNYILQTDFNKINE